MKFGCKDCGVTRSRILLLIILAGLLPRTAFSDAETSAPVDLVAFFKLALSSPPDIEHFEARQIELHAIPVVGPAGKMIQMKPPPTDFQGARAGSNYFLQLVSGTNREVSTLAGRSGTEIYTFSPNSITHTFDAPAGDQNKGQLATIGAAMSRPVSQFLNMGVSSVQFNTLVWKENEFDALDDKGRRLHGSLEISNNFPVRLVVTSPDDSDFCSAISYHYPDPPTAMGGFPDRMVLSGKVTDGWEDDLELRLVVVKLAVKLLPEDFFNSAQFVDKKINHTLLESNGLLYNVTASNVVPVHSRSAFPEVPSNRRRQFVFTWLLIGTGIPLLLLLISLVKKRKPPKQTYTQQN